MRGRPTQIVPRTKRERAVNLGTPETAVDGSTPVGLVDWAADDSMASAMTLYVQVEEFTIPASALGTADFRPMVHVEWGNGAATNQTDLECTYRQRLPFVCSTLIAQGFIASFPLALSDGTFATADVPVGARAKFRAFIAIDPDAVPLFATRWVTQLNLVAGVIEIGQARLATLRAFCDATASKTAGFFLLFDKSTAPVANDVPVDGFPFQPQPALSDTASGAIALALGQTRAFVNGIAWGISSTPFKYTPIVAARAFVCAELET